MFRGKHALLQGCGCVAEFYRYLGLAQHFASVELFRDDVDGAAAHIVAGLDGPGVRVEAAIFREQGRVNVDDPFDPFSNEPGRENPHEAGKRDGADAEFVQRSAQ